MTHRLRIAAVQMDAAPAPVADRLARAGDLVAEAASAGAQVIVLPELFNSGYAYSDHNYTLPEPLDGQTVGWMRAQAAEHAVHLTGSLLLRDGDEVYNTALLFAPDGRMWRYDKQYPYAWERAYFREGDGITIADTDLGKLGIMLCWDSAHSELWERYAGEVQAMLIPSSPPTYTTVDVLLPDGQRVTSDIRAVSPRASRESVFGSDLDKRAAWMRVPVILTSGAGTFRSALPMPKVSVAGFLLLRPALWRHIQDAPRTQIEAGYYATKIIGADGSVLGRVEEAGDGFTLAEVELPPQPPMPSATKQPRTTLSPVVTFVIDHIVTALMIRLYREGLRRQFGARMAPYDTRTLVWAGVTAAAAVIGWLVGRWTD